MGDSRARRRSLRLRLHHQQFQGNCQHLPCSGADRVEFRDEPPHLRLGRCPVGRAAAMAGSRYLRLDDCPQAIVLRRRQAKVDLRPLDADWVLKARGLRLDAKPRRKAIAKVVKPRCRTGGRPRRRKAVAKVVKPRRRTGGSSLRRPRPKDVSNLPHHLPHRRAASSRRLHRHRKAGKSCPLHHVLHRPLHPVLRHRRVRHHRHVHHRARTRSHCQKIRQAPSPPPKSKEFACAWRQLPFTRLISIRLMLG
jgi:hypothetical protein